MRRALPLILLLGLLAPAAAHASAASVIRDCTDDGRLSRSYSQQELRSALANLPSDVDEYTNCREVIRAAQLSGGGGGASPLPGTTPGTTPGGGAPSGGGATGGGAAGTDTGSAPGPFGGFAGYPTNPATGATPQEKTALAQARVDPHAREVTELAASPLPAPLIVVLAIGALGLLTLGALDLRRRVLARRDL